MLEHFRHDLWLALRGFRKAKGFFLAAVLTLAVGSAGTTVMFALIQGVLLKPLPVHEQDRVLVAWQEIRASGFAHYPFRAEQIDTIGRESQLLHSVAGVDYNGAFPTIAVENDVAVPVTVAAVKGDLFGVLGVGTTLGRALDLSDDAPGAEPALVISHGLWQRRYGGSRDVLGRVVTLRERPFRIVGVATPGFEYPRGAEAWLTMAALSSTIKDPAFVVYVDLVARLRPGATFEQAEGELAALVTRLEAEAAPGSARGLTPVVQRFEDLVVGEDVRTAMVALFGAVILLLLIASANVANLLLMRGEARRAERAVRMALGASRGRLVRQVLAESLVLAAMAGALGLIVSSWSLQAAVALVPGGLPRVDSVAIDPVVALFTVGVTFATTLLAGLAPALSSARVDLLANLRSGERGAIGASGASGPGGGFGRRALVVSQVALAVTVVAGAGLLTRSLLRLQSVDMGLAADRLVFVELAPPTTKYAERTKHLQFLDALVERLQTGGSVASATPVNVPPFSGTGGWDAPRFAAEGQSADRAAENPSLNLESIYPNYFQTFGVTLVRGRAFADSDREGAVNVAIVSEDVAARTWPGEDPIGKRLKMGGVDSKDEWRSVVGVAAATRYRELSEARPTLYLPSAQFVGRAEKIVLRSTESIDRVGAIARQAVLAVDPDVRIVRIARFQEFLDVPLARPRFNVALIAIFSVAALLLATIGFYAVMAAYVGQRDREIGVRMALGADASNVRRLVLREGLGLAGLGASLGVAGVVVGSRLLRGILFETDPLDPSTIATAVIVLMAAGALASYLPARRATRIDPATMLQRG